MPAVGLSSDEYSRVFGARQADDAPGRSRRCRSCGGWHRTDEPWPHNCRPPAMPRNRDLATPQIAPKFEAFRTGQLEGAETINSRRDKINYMDKHGLAEWDEGIKPERDQTQKEWRAEFVAALKRFRETDPLNIEPVDRIGERDLGGASEIDTTDIEVFGDR